LCASIICPNIDNFCLHSFFLHFKMPFLTMGAYIHLVGKVHVNYPHNLQADLNHLFFEKMWRIIFCYWMAVKTAPHVFFPSVLTQSMIKHNKIDMNICFEVGCSFFFRRKKPALNLSYCYLCLESNKTPKKNHIDSRNLISLESGNIMSWW
jgi:hypothetical protein